MTRRWLRRVACLLLLVGLNTGRAPAQDLLPHRHPLSVYLDLRPTDPGRPAQTTPAWIEALEFTPGAKAPAVTDASVAPLENRAINPRAIFRIRLQKPVESASDQLQARVFFQDSATGDRPQVTLWNEIGECLLQPVPLGQHLGLPSSETLTLPMQGVDYLEIEADGDGAQVRGVFLSWLETAEVLQPSDFRSKEKVRQPFRKAVALPRRKHDSSLYGVVTASLQTGTPLVLKPTENPMATFQFELERQPLVAVVTYETLGVAVDAPPSVTVNGRALGSSTLHLPDLADPGFQGESRETEGNLTFRYTGWLPAQKTIPGATLAAGLNSLSLGLSNGTDPVAVRAVSIQLKYDWEKLDYVLAPAPSSVPHENP